MKKIVLLLGPIIILTFFSGCAIRLDFCECTNIAKTLTDPYFLTEKEIRAKKEGCKWIYEELSPAEFMQHLAECD